MATLDTYRQKRNFKSTSEPRGRKARRSGHSFVIQKHDATRLHYDFRLEMDGVLKSWAVTRGPSLMPSEKRLAVHVEDHPLAYGDFEGTIPKGEYGGGTVIVWDRGTWEPIGDARKAYAKGHMEFTLDGEKLHGRWHLVRMHGKPGEKRENWLLIKGDDEFAVAQGEDDLLDVRPESVKTGRDIEDVAGEEPGWSSKTGRIRKSSKKKAETKAQKQDKPAVEAPDTSGLKGARKTKLPDFLPPTLATLAAAPPAGKRWLHEIKFRRTAPCASPTRIGSTGLTRALPRKGLRTITARSGATSPHISSAGHSRSFARQPASMVRPFSRNTPGRVSTPRSSRCRIRQTRMMSPMWRSRISTA